MQYKYFNGRNFSGSLNGTATNANNVRVDHDTGDAWHRICFVDMVVIDESNIRIRTNDNNSTIAANPNDGTIRATTFIGALNGNATSATTATNSFNWVVLMQETI